MLLLEKALDEVNRHLCQRGSPCRAAWGCRPLRHLVVVLGDGDVVVSAKELAFWGLFGLRVARRWLYRRVKSLGRGR